MNSLTYPSKATVNSELGDTVNSELGATGPEFRADYILIYVLLLFLKGGGGGKVLFFNIFSSNF